MFLLQESTFPCENGMSFYVRLHLSKKRTFIFLPSSFFLKENPRNSPVDPDTQRVWRWSADIGGDRRFPLHTCRGGKRPSQPHQRYLLFFLLSNARWTFAQLRELISTEGDIILFLLLIHSFSLSSLKWRKRVRFQDICEEHQSRSSILLKKTK